MSIEAMSIEATSIEAMSSSRVAHRAFTAR
jgi:hypothetical protein